LDSEGGGGGGGGGGGDTDSSCFGIAGGGVAGGSRESKQCWEGPRQQPSAPPSTAPTSSSRRSGVDVGTRVSWEGTDRPHVAPEASNCVYVDGTCLGLDRKGRLAVRKVLGRGLLLLTTSGPPGEKGRPGRPGRIVSLDEKGRTTMALRPGERFTTERVGEYVTMPPSDDLR
jgi:hypothetical protein